jgi:hypothetical protein
VKKTINGKTITSDTEFSFTLRQTSGGTVYTDDSYTTAIPANGIQATIKGSGKTQFGTLYFTKTGTYTFTMTEDALTETARKKGYSKDRFPVPAQCLYELRHDPGRHQIPRLYDRVFG